MRTIVTLIAGVAMMAAAQAQPTLTFAENAPTPGTEYTLRMGPYVQPGNSGANQTWDLSSLTTDSTIAIVLTAPGDVAGNEAFPGATVAETGNEATMFWRAANDGMYLVGSLAEGTAISYSDQGRYLPYPCTYQTNWTDEVAATFEAEDMTITRTGTIVGEADGYGTLIMPDATIPNVLRVHWLETTIDEMELFEMTSVYDSYLYFEEGRSYPIAQIVTATINFFGTETTAQFTQWYGDINTFIGVQAVVNNELQAWPNPANGEFQLKVPASMQGEIFVQFMDAAGRAAHNARYTTDTNGLIELSTEGLAPGMYMVSATDGAGTKATMRLSVQ